MIMHHHTKFGHKTFPSSDVQKNIEILALCCDLDPEHSNPIFSQDTLASDDVPTKSGCKRINIFEEIIESCMWIISAFTMTLTLKTAIQSFHMTLLTHDNASTYQVW